MTRRATLSTLVALTLALPTLARAPATAAEAEAGVNKQDDDVYAVQALAQAFSLPFTTEGSSGASTSNSGSTGDVFPTSAPYIPTDGSVATQSDFGAPAPLPADPCVRRKLGGASVFIAFCTPDPPKGKGPPSKKAKGPNLPSLAELAGIASDTAISIAPQPRLRVAPSGVGLTGLDSYFWLADELTSVRAVARVPGLTVVAQAHPVQYVWDFGDGQDLVTSHGGTPWSRRRPGDISHVYEGRGRFAVSVEIVWEARWRVGGGSWRSLGYFSNSDTEVHPVRQMVAALVPSG